MFCSLLVRLDILTEKLGVPDWKIRGAINVCVSMYALLDSCRRVLSFLFLLCVCCKVFVHPLKSNMESDGIYIFLAEYFCCYWMFTYRCVSSYLPILLEYACVISRYLCVYIYSSCVETTTGVGCIYAKSVNYRSQRVYRELTFSHDTAVTQCNSYRNIQ